MSILGKAQLLFSLQTLNDLLTARNGILMPPGGNLGIPRTQMPQISDWKRFENTLKEYGISIKKVRRRIGDLKIIQGEVNKDKVFKLMLKYREANQRTRGGINIPGFPPVISNDGYILDGNHRQIAMYNVNRHAYQDYTMIDMPIKELYSFIRENNSAFMFSVKYKSL
jgi:hypothetical protein